jgi:N-dimethylarginine dimethylaminohydrolase
MDLSEHSVRPSRILLHDPAHGNSLELLGEDRLAQVNFFSLPNREVVYKEYQDFVTSVAAHTTVTYLKDLLGEDPEFIREAAENPNLMFMRDSTITIPWMPNTFIPARLALPTRANEPGLVSKAMRSLGLTQRIEFTGDEYIEGGDVLPVMREGVRALLVGFGVRTTEAAAIKLASELIPETVDQIIGLSHDPDLLHLDTGFTVLPKDVILAARGMFSNGFLIDQNKTMRTISPIEYAEQMGFRIIRTEKADAIAHERCNMLPLGEGAYLAFDMPNDFKSSLEAAAGISIHTVSGAEISKAAGGAHCLTRPLYL